MNRPERAHRRPAGGARAALDAQTRPFDPVARPSAMSSLRDPLLPAGPVFEAGHEGLRAALELLNNVAGRARDHAQRHTTYATRAEGEGDNHLAALHRELVKVHGGYAVAFVEAGRRLRGAL